MTRDEASKYTPGLYLAFKLSGRFLDKRLQAIQKLLECRNTMTEEQREASGITENINTSFQQYNSAFSAWAKLLDAYEFCCDPDKHTNKEVEDFVTQYVKENATNGID